MQRCAVCLHYRWLTLHAAWDCVAFQRWSPCTVSARVPLLPLIYLFQGCSWNAAPRAISVTNTYWAAPARCLVCVVMTCFGFLSHLARRSWLGVATWLLSAPGC